MNVFYSWQSSLNHETHLKFIRKALSAAIVAAGQELGLEEAQRPELDEAQKDPEGADNIVARILSKISLAALFVADVTPIFETEDGRLLPNPNVLYELGWATAKLDYKRCILVMNDSPGHKPKDMPFDICQRPIIRYSLKTGFTQNQYDKALDRLTDELAAAIVSNLSKLIIQKAQETPVLGHPSADNDVSIWKADDYLIHVPGGIRRKSFTVSISTLPRAYLRVIPASWPDGVPTIHTVRNAPPPVWPPNGSNGDAAAYDLGFARFWYDGRPEDEGYFTSNVALYIETTGEYWVLDGNGSFEHRDTGLVFWPQNIARNWNHSLQLINQQLDMLGASKTRKIVLGATGIKGAKAVVGRSLVPSRKSSVQVERTLSDWNNTSQRQVVLDGFNKMADAIDVEPIDIEQFKKVVPL